MENFFKAQNWLKKLESEAAFLQKKNAGNLDLTQKFLDEMGRPDQFFHWRIIVGGTAGKGTLCRQVSATLSRAGKKVAVLTSPHLQTPIERIRLGADLIDPNFFGEKVLEVQKIAEKIGESPTFYEAILLAGIAAAKDFGAEVLVGEIGLGGEWDSMNAVSGKRISVLTFCGSDHLDILGPRVSDLAQTKSGIFTADSVANFSGEKNHQNILQQVAQKNSSKKVEFIENFFENSNQKCVQKIAEKVLGFAPDKIPEIRLPARWEKFGNVILDLAHSGERFDFLVPKIKEISGSKVAVLGMTQNRNPKDLKKILPFFEHIFWSDFSINDRKFWSPNQLQKIFKKGEVFKNIDAIQNRFPKNTILVTGSHFLCGAIRERFVPTSEILAQRSEFPKIT